MSPSMVDFLSPASSSSSKVQSNRHRSQSFVTGVNPSSPSLYIFRSSGIPDPSPFMDQSNLGQGVSAPTEKISVSRFRRQRKRPGNARAIPATIASDSGAGLGLKPNRSELLYATPFDPEDGGTQFVQEQLHGWQPFESDVSNRSSYGTGFVFSAGLSGSNASSSNIGLGSVKGNAFDVSGGGSGDIGKGTFVFGSEMEKKSSWSSSRSQSSSTENLGNANSTKFKSVETGLPVGGSVCSLGEGNVFSDNGVFVFRSSGNNDGNLCASSSLGSETDSFYKLNSSKNVNEKSGKPDSGIFVHKKGENKSIHSSTNSSFVSGDGLFTEQPDRTRKKDQQNSDNVIYQKADSGLYVFGRFVEAQANLDQTSTMCSDGSSFSTVSKLPEDLMKLKIDTSENGENGNKDPGVFIFGSGVNKSSCANKSSTFDSFESSFSKLPQKMEKLNLAGQVHGDTESGPTASSLKKHSQFNQTSSSGHDVGGFSMFPGELNKQNLQSSGNEEHGNDNHGVFVFGRTVRKDANSGKSSSLNFDDSSISKLPDEIKNMMLNSSGSEDDTQESKPGNMWRQHNNNAASNFSLHSGKEDYVSRVTPLQTHNSCGLSSEPPSFPSTIPGFQTSVNHFYFTSIDTGSETPMEFRSQKQDISLLTKENLFTKPHKNMTSGMKKEDIKGFRLKNKRGKSRKSTPMHAGTAKQFVSVDKGPGENYGQDSTGGDSPMDYSPYQETLVSNHCSREAPIATAESIHFDSRCASNDAQKSSFVDRKEGAQGGLFSAVEHFDTNEILHENEEADCCIGVPSDSHFTYVDEMTSGLGKGSLEAINENVESVVQAKSSSMESESFSRDSSIKKPTYDGEFMFNSCSQDCSQSKILFAATSTTSSVRGPPSASKRNYPRKKNVKADKESHPNFKLPLASPPSNMFLFTNAHASTDPKQEQKGIYDGVKAREVDAVKPNHESAEEVCEKWRLRGNQAYADGNLSKAEDYYSRGVNSFSFNENSKSCSRALMLCYSNRAATRMSLGRMREALSDCKMAVAMDPSFLRAQVRAGNIHLFLGEPADALQHFKKVLQLDKEAKSDQKILLEAVDGLEKTQKLNDLIDQSSIFLTKRNPDDATKALEIISEALFIAPHSEILLEMKAEALVKLRNFDEAIQICEQTLEFAEKNASATETDCQSKDTDCSKSMERSHFSFWRWRIISKSYFYLGKLEEANDLLQRHEKVKPVIDKYQESSTSFPVTVCELLRLKAAGNEAFQAGRHLEAVELYTAALTLNTESRPFTAICFCNRAAAYQALGQITDAIADCSLAIALDSMYKKAISRRATLYEMIRDYGQAATDLRKLTSLLEMRSEDKSSTSGALGRSSSNINDLNQARMRLSTLEEEARKGDTLDMYMILGLERSCSATDVRKAYRKAALRHHPDKAGQFLARSENCDDSVWREIAEEVHSDADRLFKMIGEAYAILVDPSKRLQYDTEEDLRTMKKGYGPYGANSTPRTPASTYNNQHERSSSSRTWCSYGNSYRR